MNLEVLSTSESMSLCRAAAGLVLGRFRLLADQTETQDPKLNQLFTDLADEVERSLVEMDQLDGQARLPEVLDEKTGQQVARGFLPSLSKGHDGVRMGRESGFYLVECVLEDLARFYGVLARQSSDEKSRELLLRWKSAIGSRLLFLQHVVL